MAEYDIHDKVFNLNQFVEARGSTKNLRLDEIEAVIARRNRGEKTTVGDASAYDVVNWVLARAGVVGHELFMQLHEAFAEAILRVAGDEPYMWVNPQAAHEARRLGLLIEPNDMERPDFSHVRNGYPKPTDDEAEETRKAQEEVTAREKFEADKQAETERLKADQKAAKEKAAQQQEAPPVEVKLEGGKASGKGSSSRTGDGKKKDEDLKRLLGDGDNK